MRTTVDASTADPHRSTAPRMTAPIRLIFAMGIIDMDVPHFKLVTETADVWTGATLDGNPERAHTAPLSLSPPPPLSLVGK